MKISKVIKNGELRWRVNDLNGPNGKRQRKFFETKEGAEAFIKERSAEKRAPQPEPAQLPTDIPVEVVLAPTVALKLRVATRAFSVLDPSLFVSQHQLT